MTRDALAGRIRDAIDACLAGDAPPLDSLFLAVHRWQVDHDPVVAALTDEVGHWTDIPAVPVGLFRSLRVGTVAPDEPHRTFLTSGTTGGRGAHHVRDTALYDRGALGWFRACVPDAPGDIVGLLEDPARVPTSSLSHMVGLFPRGGGTVTWHQRDGVLDRAGLRARLATAPGPVFLAATGFALADWLDGETPVLPAGSIAMVTGGFKGRVHHLDHAELYTQAADRLGARLITEYGMTELSSQLWGTPDTDYRPPPWLRAVAADPWTGRPLGPGGRGQLRFYDLCNLDSTLGVETLDEGVVHPDGRVTLYGRLPGAPARGCSLTVEEAWARRA